MVIREIGEALAEALNDAPDEWTVRGWECKARVRPEDPRSVVHGTTIVNVVPMDLINNEDALDRCGCPKVHEHHIVVVEKPPKDATGREYADPDRLFELFAFAEELNEFMLGVDVLGDKRAVQSAVPQFQPLFNELFLEQHRIWISELAVFYELI